ncbi:MAG TPA: LCP family protein, partial [Chloroflexota bacterium]|nr:LCP family protein [Chloroflexota bacterium]
MRLIVSRALWVVLGVAYVAYVGGGLSIGGTAFASALRTVALSAPAAALSTSPHVAFDVSNVRDPSKLIRDAPLFWIPDWTGTDRINILLMGVDQREDERAAGIPTRTDTMSVLSIDPVRKNATLISFPRDLWVPIPGLGEQRINEAYPFGELRHLEGGGAGLAERTMEQNFGLHISHYALVNFTGFQELINMVGGVVIDVPRPIVDDAYPTEDYSIQRLYFA